MRAAASLHRYKGGRALTKERDQLGPPQVDPQHRSIRCIHRMQRDYRLGRVDGNAANLSHGRLLSWVVRPPSLARDAVGPSTPTMTGGLRSRSEWKNFGRGAG